MRIGNGSPVTVREPIRAFAWLSAVAAIFVWLGVAPALEGTEFYEPVLVGSVTDSRIREISGMVSVTGHPLLFWTHNDSKDAARFFCVHQDGTVLAEVTVTGASNQDWEDSSKGPGPLPGLDYLYIADSGNNGRNRSDLKIVRVLEPTIDPERTGQRLSAPADVIPYKYPDGNFDCEAMVVDPDSGMIYLITKRSSKPSVYRFAHVRTGEAQQTILRLGDFPSSDLVTAADITADGQRLIVRNYSEIYEYTRAPNQPFQDIFFAPRRILPDSPSEAKSESICFDHREIGYLTTNEGNPAPIRRAYERVPQASCSAEVDPERFFFTRGDVVQHDDEGGPRAVNVADGAGILDIIDGELEIDCLDRADLQDDGVVDEDDVDVLLAALSRGLTSIRVPFRRPGLDTTSDDLPCLEEDVLRMVEPATQTWRYRLGNESVPDDWFEPLVDDSEWEEGVGGIGFGSANMETTIPRVTSTHTLFARGVFEFVPGQEREVLVLELDHNDGFVAYLNGVEVARDRLGEPGFTVPREFPATLHSGGRPADFYICPDLLVPGENVLAIEVHNRRTDDTTLFFRAGARALNPSEMLPPPSDAPAGDARMSFQVDPISPGSAGTALFFIDTDAKIRGFSFRIRYQDGIEVQIPRVLPAFSDRLITRSYRSAFSGTIGFAGVFRSEPGEGGVDLDGRPVLEFSVAASTEGMPAIQFSDRTTGTLPLLATVVDSDLNILETQTDNVFVDVSDSGLPVIDSIAGGEGRAGTNFFVVGRRFDSPKLSVLVCGANAEFLVVDDQTLRVTAPDCDQSGPASVSVCNEAGCAFRAAGFIYEPSGAQWIRGDANGDSAVDISDAIAILGNLFLGEEVSPACDAALDANGDEARDLSDAIFLLTFLFQGGADIPPPYPEPADCP
ncbi:MAG: IPT/TIG domain-containing protein [Planctomycetota bacterium]